MSADHEDCQKAFKAIKHLYGELQRLDSDTVLLGQLYQVCSASGSSLSKEYLIKCLYEVLAS